MKKYMHLSLDERNTIEQELNNNKSFKEIAILIEKDPTTISKEVKRHRFMKEGQSIHTSPNICGRRFNCKRKHLCKDNCNRYCKDCYQCNEICSDFIDGTCIRLKHAPYVCNGCNNKFQCRLTKYYYKASSSHKIYRTKLSESRQGINMTESELYSLDKIISPLVKKGLSLSLICKTHDLKCSRATLYKYLDKNCFSIGPLDLPRKVRLKKRKQHRKHKDTKIRISRTYEDFQKYTEENPDLPIIEMDTVEGTKGGPVLLTMMFRQSKLMLAFILPHKTQNEVLNVFNYLEKELGLDLFEKTFPIILTDNGTEFSNPLSLEFNFEGIGRTRIFYCNPRASYQKGMIEKNHEFIRYVLPKGTSFEGLTQEQITLMINHINSLARESLNWNSPIDVAKVTLDKIVIKKLNLSKIPTEQIQLNKKLLKK